MPENADCQGWETLAARPVNHLKGSKSKGIIAIECCRGLLVPPCVCGVMAAGAGSPSRAESWLRPRRGLWKTFVCFPLAESGGPQWAGRLGAEGGGAFMLIRCPFLCVSSLCLMGQGIFFPLKAAVSECDVAVLQSTAPAWRMTWWVTPRGSIRGCWWFSFRYRPRLCAE